jgi:hypothetical protein
MVNALLDTWIYGQKKERMLSLIEGWGYPKKMISKGGVSGG